VKFLISFLLGASFLTAAYVSSVEAWQERLEKTLQAKSREEADETHLKNWREMARWKPWDGLPRKRLADYEQALGESAPAQRFDYWKSAERNYADSVLQIPCYHLAWASVGNLLRQAGQEQFTESWAACYENALTLYPMHAALRDEYGEMLYDAAAAKALSGDDDASGWFKRAEEIGGDPFCRGLVLGVLRYLSGHREAAWAAWAGLEGLNYKQWPESMKIRRRKMLWRHAMAVAESAVEKQDWQNARRALDVLLVLEERPGPLLRDLARRFGACRRELFGGDAAALTMQHFESAPVLDLFQSNVPVGEAFARHEIEPPGCERLAIRENVPMQALSAAFPCRYLMSGEDERVALRVRLSSACEGGSFSGFMRLGWQDPKTKLLSGWVSGGEASYGREPGGAHRVENRKFLTPVLERYGVPMVTVHNVGVQAKGCRDICVDSMEWFLPQF
jgi:hypothetical protein